VAPDAKVEMKKEARFRGAICAKEIDVKKDVVFIHHSSSMSLPKKSAPVIAANENERIPTEFALEQNYPNPFNPSTNITFALPEAGEITLAIYNLRGQLVRTLFSGALTAGRHQVVWDSTTDNGARVASGLYIYRLRAKNFVADKKLVLLK